ncbi:MAG: hypothetical protein OEY14_00870, partial [Myxococcales bacterium]|nr:hypothetical protein [Myxococcales bacterium]
MLPFGEAKETFFPDTFLALLCRAALDAGHDARLVRVYYDGRDPERDLEIGRRLEAWLDARQADLVVIERFFDPAPVRRHIERAPGRHTLVLSWGDADPIEGADFLIGMSPGATRTGRTRRSPWAGEMVEAFKELLSALVSGSSLEGLPGVARLVEGRIEAARPGRRAPLPSPFQPVLEHDVIALEEPPPLRRHYLLGNAGCPFADDPLENEHYAGLSLPRAEAVARLGCAFCFAGGDYQKRPDAEVVGALLEQIRYFRERSPSVRDFVVADQHPLRYLGPLIEAAALEGAREIRWLFSARVDSFVRERDRVVAAVEAARAAGHRLELYLSGFESFSDRELLRYNKGATASDLIAAVAQMRELALAYPGSFEYARAQGHSLILYSPWTTPEELLESVGAIRKHGLVELFSELGRNRVRLYRDLPIYYAAERDGAVIERWEGGDSGAGRRKGYAVERPWRFLDPRTRLARDLAEGLRELLGAQTELSQLRAAAEHARSLPPQAAGLPPEAVLEPVRTLERRMRALAGAEAAGPAARSGRGSSEPASPILFAGSCNNGCPSCANGDRYLPDEEHRLERELDEARAGGRSLLFAGREPTLHPGFLRLVRRGLGDDAR